MIIKINYKRNIYYHSRKKWFQINFTYVSVFKYKYQFLKYYFLQNNSKIMEIKHSDKTFEPNNKILHSIF